MTFCSINYDGSDEHNPLICVHAAFESEPMLRYCSYCGVVIPDGELFLLTIWDAHDRFGTTIQKICAWCEDWFSDSEIGITFDDDHTFKIHLEQEIDSMSNEDFEESYQNFMQKPEPLRLQFEERFPEVMDRINLIRKEIDEDKE